MIILIQHPLCAQQTKPFSGIRQHISVSVLKVSILMEHAKPALQIVPSVLALEQNNAFNVNLGIFMMEMAV